MSDTPYFPISQYYTGPIRVFWITYMYTVTSCEPVIFVIIHVCIHNLYL